MNLHNVAPGIRQYDCHQADQRVKISQPAIPPVAKLWYRKAVQVMKILLKPLEICHPLQTEIFYRLAYFTERLLRNF